MRPLSRIILAAGLGVLPAGPASAQDFPALLRTLKPVLCVPKAKVPSGAPLEGVTEYYDREKNLLHTSDDSPQNAVAVVENAKLALFKAMLAFSEDSANGCPRLSAEKLRQCSQVYALDEFIAFDGPSNRVPLKNGVISETMTFLYRGEDGVVHIGREKIVSDDGTMITESDRNAGGSGYGKQGREKRVGKLHTHPNADAKGFFPVPAHHPSRQDIHEKHKGFYDVVVSPLYVYFINASPQMVFSRKQTFAENKVKSYLRKAKEADAYYDKFKKWPAWFTEDFNAKNNPWAQ